MIQPTSMYSPSDTDGHNPLDILYNAIILQAVKDFRSARRILNRHPDNKKAAGVVKEIARFFRSEYFTALTDLDGPTLLRRLMAEEYGQSGSERKAPSYCFKPKHK